MDDSPRTHQIIVFVLACRSAVPLRERLVDLTFLSYAVLPDHGKPAIPVVGLAASHE